MLISFGGLRMDTSLVSESCLICFESRSTLASALSVLNERRIFEARRLAEDPTTLAELAEEFGLCRERVRQIEGELLREGAEGREEPRRGDEEPSCAAELEGAAGAQRLGRLTTVTRAVQSNRMSGADMMTMAGMTRLEPAPCNPLTFR